MSSFDKEHFKIDLKLIIKIRLITQLCRKMKGNIIALVKYGRLRKGIMVEQGEIWKVLIATPKINKLSLGTRIVSIFLGLGGVARNTLVFENRNGLFAARTHASIRRTSCDKMSTHARERLCINASVVCDERQTRF